MLAQYILHNKNTLSYLKYTLYKIDKLKIVFIKYCLQNTTHNKNNENKIYFNILKFYILTYYIIFIQLFDNV